MKNFFSKRSTASVALILVVVFCIPLLGGLKLSAAYRNVFSDFNKSSAEYDEHNNSLLTDMERAVQSARTILDATKSMLSSDDRSVLALIDAIDAFDSATSMMDRYAAYTDAASAARFLYGAVEGSITDEGLHSALKGEYFDLTSYEARIKNSYSDYAATRLKADELLSTPLAAQIAKLWGIGK